SGKAAQFTSIQGLWLRSENIWMARAISSLPEPVSPVMRTAVGCGATRWIMLMSFLLASLRMIASTPSPSWISAGSAKLVVIGTVDNVGKISLFVWFQRLFTGPSNVSLILYVGQQTI